MKELLCFVLCLTAALVLAAALPSATLANAADAAKPARRFVCAPCRLPCERSRNHNRGTCPACGMPLIEEGTAAQSRPRKKVAILIFDGVEIIDYTGPYEVFGASGFDVYTVAQSKQPVTTAMGMTVVPKYTFADAPPAQVIVVPGGGVRAARDSASTLAWVRNQTAQAEHTMSVCNGAFILASAGLLDGMTATTTAHLIDRLAAEFPRTRVVSDRRFVDNGKIITTAGLSSGIDGALHVVAGMLGPGTAQAAALGLEYDWRPQSGFARAALADMLIPEIDLDAIGHWEFVSTEGGTDRWETVVHGTSELSAAKVMEHLERELLAKGKWIRTGGAAPSTTTWKFSGRDGSSWRGTLTLSTPPGQSRQYTAKLIISRD